MWAIATKDAFYLGTDDWFLVEHGRHPLTWDRLFSLQREGTPAVRPLSLAFARLCHLLFGDACLPRRALILALHAAAATSVYLLGRRWDGERAGRMAALLFLVWPLHAETLSWFHSGETAVPFATLSLAALAAFVHGVNATWVVLFQLTALLFRENAVVLGPLMVALGTIDARDGDRRWRDALHAGLTRARWPLAVTLGWIAVRAAQVISALDGHSGAALPFADDPLDAVATVLFHVFCPVLPGFTVSAALAIVSAIAIGVGLWRAFGGPERPSFAGLRGLLLALTFAAPFVPLLDASDPLFEVYPGIYERRWYHLYPVVAGLTLVLGRAAARLGAPWAALPPLLSGALLILPASTSSRPRSPKALPSPSSSTPRPETPSSPSSSSTRS
ncbi:MAG: hypothetical protein IV100_29130 [Myxococcales bacterium]|nr:hypothetical protein [Myxococcales bacterium]